MEYLRVLLCAVLFLCYIVGLLRLSKCDKIKLYTDYINLQFFFNNINDIEVKDLVKLINLLIFSDKNNV